MIPPGDVPCVVAIALATGGRILLIRRANPPAEGTWSLPGGRVEPGEFSESAVLRELEEETGGTAVLDRYVGEVVRDSPDGGRYVIRAFLVDMPEGQQLAAGDDAADVGWFTMAEILDLDTSPGLADTLNDWGIARRKSGRGLRGETS